MNFFGSKKNQSQPFFKKSLLIFVFITGLLIGTFSFSFSPTQTFAEGFFARIFNNLSRNFAAVFLAGGTPTTNYQGRLTDTSGNPVANGNYNIEFKLYTVATSGSPIWTETHVGANKIPVSNGLFSVLLGSLTSLSGIDFNQTLYLGVDVEGTGASPTFNDEMIPRKRLGTVPTAFVSNTLNGITDTQFIRSDQNNLRLLLNPVIIGDSNTAIGTSSDNSVAIGSHARVDTNSDSAIAIGNSSYISPTSTNSVAIGLDAFVDGTSSIALLGYSTTSNEFTVGDWANNGTPIKSFRLNDETGNYFKLENTASGTTIHTPEGPHNVNLNFIDDTNGQNYLQISNVGDGPQISPGPGPGSAGDLYLMTSDGATGLDFFSSGRVELFSSSGGYVNLDEDGSFNYAPSFGTPRPEFDVHGHPIVDTNTIKTDSSNLITIKNNSGNQGLLLGTNNGNAYAGASIVAGASSSNGSLELDTANILAGLVLDESTTNGNVALFTSAAEFDIKGSDGSFAFNGNINATNKVIDFGGYNIINATANFLSLTIDDGSQNILIGNTGSVISPISTQNNILLGPGGASIDDNVQLATVLGYSTYAGANNAVVVGQGSYVSDPGSADSVAIGSAAGVNSQSGIALGNQAFIDGTSSNAIAIGTNALIDTNASYSIAIGNSSQAHGDDSIAFGQGVMTDASSSGAYAIGFGVQILNSGDVIAMGNGTSVHSADGALAIIPGGGSINDRSYNAVALGSGTFIGTDSENAVAIGNSAQVSMNSSNSIAFGSNVMVLNDAPNAIAIGQNFNFGATGTIAIGRTMTVGIGAENSVVVGYGNDVEASSAVMVGSASVINAGNYNTVGLGYNITTAGDAHDTFIFGNGSLALSANGIVMGVGADIEANSASAIAIGDSALVDANSTYSIAIGDAAAINSTSSDSVALGTNALVDSNSPNSIALGSNALVDANSPSSIAIGVGAYASGTEATAIGPEAANANGYGSVAIGRADVENNFSIALGYSAYTNATGTLAIGDHGDANPITNVIFNGSSTARISNVTDPISAQDALTLHYFDYHPANTLSDERLKNIQGPLPYGLADVEKLNTILYTWKPETEQDTSVVFGGFSAQNVLSALPLAVSTTSNGYYGISDRTILAAVVNSVKQIGGFIGEIGDGIIHLKNLAIGTSAKPDGITMYDEDTGAPYCVKIKHGQLVNMPGACGTIPTTATVINATASSSGDTHANTNALPAGNSSSSNGVSASTTSTSTNQNQATSPSSNNSSNGNNGQNQSTSSSQNNSVSGGGNGNSGGQQSSNNISPSTSTAISSTDTASSSVSTSTSSNIISSTTTSATSSTSTISSGTSSSTNIIATSTSSQNISTSSNNSASSSSNASSTTSQSINSGSSTSSSISNQSTSSTNTTISTSSQSSNISSATTSQSSSTSTSQNSSQGKGKGLVNQTAAAFSAVTAAVLDALGTGFKVLFIWARQNIAMLFERIASYIKLLI